MLAAGSALRMVFFQGDGVLACRDPELAPAWRDLAREFGVPLELCVSSAEARGIEADPEGGGAGASDAGTGFSIAGLAQLIVAGSEATLESFP